MSTRSVSLRASLELDLLGIDARGNKIRLYGLCTAAREIKIVSVGALAVGVARNINSVTFASILDQVFGHQVKHMGGRLIDIRAVVGKVDVFGQYGACLHLGIDKVTCFHRYRLQLWQ